MKRVVKTVAWFTVLGMLVMTGMAYAQQGGGGFRGQAGMILADFLLLNPEKAEKVSTIYGDISQKRFQAMRDSGTDFQSMSDQERTDFFNKMQKETVTELQKELKDVLAEKELAAIEPIVMKRIFIPVSEVRGLRNIELKDEQRAQLQPLTVELAGKVFSPGFRFGAPQLSDDERAKAEKDFADAKEAFVKKVAGMLTEEQNTAWKEKTAEAEKEVEAMRERMRNFQRQ